MDLDPQNPRVSPILGQLLRLSKRREVTIYLRDDTLWADFIDGRGELVDPTAWFRFNCGSGGVARLGRLTTSRTQRAQVTVCAHNTIHRRED